jgi:pimeloyl-ACP methyl ester carboxylesterase
METVETPDGTKIAYSESGAGSPLVLVHGITENQRAWDPVRAALDERWHVVALDLRGHGGSDRNPPYDPVTMANDVASVVAELGLDDPLLVGHSLGGVVVSAYGGAGFPARGIVNVDQPLALGGFKEALEPLTPLLQGSPEEFAAAVGIVFSVLDGPLPAAERARLDELSTPEQDVVLGVWKPVFEMSAEDLDLMAAELSQAIAVPYLSLHGSDPGEDYPDWLHAIVPTADFDVWPEAGHYPHLTDPDRFVRRLSAFDA